MDCLVRDIESKVDKLFKAALDIDILANGYGDKNFFGLKLNIVPNTLIALVPQIEQELGITFQEDDFLDDNFYTFNGLTSIALQRIDDRAE